MEKEYNSTIHFVNSHLDIKVNYESIITKEEVEQMKSYYQHIFSERLGKSVDSEKIEVKPHEGESMKQTTSFRVKLDEPLYPGLSFLHKKTPYVLPRLIDDLIKYLIKDKQNHNLNNLQNRLIQHTVDGLNKIISSKFEIHEGPIIKI